MARKPRTQPEAEFHHITNQGARRGDIYFGDADRALFLDLIRRCHEKHNMIIHAYCLMGNHYHLLAQFPQRNMPIAMHWLGTCYSQQINRHYEFTGRLCKDRYFNSPVEVDPYFLAAARYIHRNPKDLGVPIHKLSQYDASSYGVYLGERKAPEWMRTDLLLDMFFGNREKLRQFTELPLPVDFNQTGDLAS